MTDKIPITRIINAIDNRSNKWLSELTAEDLKGVSLWVLMRFISSCNSNYDEIRDHYLIMTNEIVNLDFNALNGHDELRMRLLQMVGIGSKQYHPWIPPGKKNTRDAISQWLSKKYPELNEDEIAIYRNQDEHSLKELAYQSGLTDKEVKTLFKKKK